ncbi:hypothetical protein AK830_g11422 [Neonectria ditissima]|uniref:Uncharacterized protein n=1 Tax=Neonectria ditissima TaxID=78410 RepID=A0A0N8H545_9HYPO|nr:hypothetical protein AK830_g11422 [Neonectria ditissima]
MDAGAERRSRYGVQCHGTALPSYGLRRGCDHGRHLPVADGKKHAAGADTEGPWTPGAEAGEGLNQASSMIQPTWPTQPRYGSTEYEFPGRGVGVGVGGRRCQHCRFAGADAVGLLLPAQGD